MMMHIDNISVLLPGQFKDKTWWNPDESDPKNNGQRFLDYFQI